MADVAAPVTYVLLEIVLAESRTRSAQFCLNEAQPAGLECVTLSRMILPDSERVSSPVLDLDLVRKYSIPGPRYTSYPPATKFTTDLSTLDLEDAIADDNRAGAGPISLYFHLPFCETRCWFCGCNTVITRRRDSAAEYLDDLVREVKLTAARMDCTRSVTQIHFGGGTPDFFSASRTSTAGRIDPGLFPTVQPDCEFSVEIDPRRLSAEHVIALREIGATRASLGVQDTNPQVQLAIHRFQPQSVNQQAFDWLREHGFGSINVDLIYGLPLQTPVTFAQTVADVLSLQPGPPLCFQLRPRALDQASAENLR